MRFSLCTTKCMWWDRCDLMFVGNSFPGTLCGPVVAHGDGSRVTGEVLAREGETVTAYLLGLGYTSPPATTGVRAVRANVD